MAVCEDVVALGHSVVGTSLASGAVGVGGSRRFCHGIERQQIQCLHCLIFHVRNREGSHLAIFLRYIHAPKRERVVAALLKLAYGFGFLLWRVPNVFVYSWGFFALIFGHSFHGKSFAAE